MSSDIQMDGRSLIRETGIDQLSSERNLKSPKNGGSSYFDWKNEWSHTLPRKDDATRVVFVCSDCGVQIQVDEDMCETLIERGCVLCNGRVSTADFEQTG